MIDPRFWIVMVLLVLVAGASLHLGWKMGAGYAASKIDDELREKALDDFRAQILPRFIDKYNEQIKEAADKVAARVCEKYEAKIEALVGPDKALEIFQSIHDEINKEIDDEDTHSS